MKSSKNLSLYSRQTAVLWLGAFESLNSAQQSLRKNTSFSKCIKHLFTNLYPTHTYFKNMSNNFISLYFFFRNEQDWKFQLFLFHFLNSSLSFRLVHSIKTYYLSSCPKYFYYQMNNNKAGLSICFCNIGMDAHRRQQTALKHYQNKPFHCMWLCP